MTRDRDIIDKKRHIIDKKKRDRDIIEKERHEKERRGKEKRATEILRKRAA